MLDQRDIEALSAWIGRREEATDVLSVSPIAGLAALLDYPGFPWSSEAPPLAHWLFFQPHVRQSEIDGDGHPKRGGFLPPVPLPRRMWAGGRLEFLAPLPLGSTIDRRSTITDVRLKKGAAGDLVFVTVRHEIVVGDITAVIEEQDLVYRSAGNHSSSPGRGEDRTVTAKNAAFNFTRIVTPDSVLLFRYSALTFNGHRIHYDRDYARDIEGYEGLVVQGPFIATLLIDFFCRTFPDSKPRKFKFRAERPLTDAGPFNLFLARRSGGAVLWTTDAAGARTMSAELDAE